MKLWKLSQEENASYDTYDSMVVAAKDEAAARLIHPGSGRTWGNGRWMVNRGDGTQFEEYNRAWANSPDGVSVEYLGEAEPGTAEGTILASFNAG